MNMVLTPYGEKFFMKDAIRRQLFAVYFGMTVKTTSTCNTNRKYYVQDVCR